MNAEPSSAMEAARTGCGVTDLFKLLGRSHVMGILYLFLKEDQRVMLAILRGEFAIHGISNHYLKSVLADKTSSQINRILRRLRKHHLIKKVAHTYRYYLTSIGRRLIVAARKLIEYVIIPNLAPQAA